MTVADFKLASIAYDIILNEHSPFHKIAKNMEANYPLTNKYFYGLGEELKSYLATRPQPRPF